MIEPHANLLKKPEENQLLYKIIRSEYFPDMVDKSYLYLNRVDKFPSDINDSNLPASDRKKYDSIKIGNTNFSWSDNCDRGRIRTYATCFSMSESSYLWDQYAGKDKNAVCLVFNAKNLISYLNNTFQNGLLLYKNLKLNNFFFINHGIVDYFKDDLLTDDEIEILNPIKYVYSKEYNKFYKDNEFRTSISCLGIYKDYILNFDNEKILFDFPEGLAFDFNYSFAKKNNIITDIKFNYKPDDEYFLRIKTILLKKGLEIYLAE